MPSPQALPSSSPTNSDTLSRHSDQHTPTSYHRDGDGVPERNIKEWDTRDVAGYVSSLGLDQYYDAFLDNEIDGEALIHLDHEFLKEIGVVSVGHRLTILKNVYHIKIAHDVPIEPDHYVPVSADADETEKAATQHDIQRLITIIRQRDERISQAENELRKMHDSMTKLREDLLPVWRLIKDKNQALPTPAHGSGYPAPPPTTVAYPDPPRSAREEREERREREKQDREQVQDPPPSNATLQPSLARGLSRKFSMKKLILGTPKNASPTHPTHPENAKTEYDAPLQTGSMSNGNSGMSLSANMPNSLSSNNLPSPTSPASTIYSPPGSALASNHNSQANLQHRPSDSSIPRGGRSRYDHDDQPTGSSGGGGGGSSNSVEIFKSFRVSMDDPCYKVLPAALKRYNIQADWRQYALYIVHGDQERCLGLEERPLILFKQLDREGRKPMFMLRRNANTDAGGNISVPGGVL
ncbi:hypothetical protein RUND412_002337 [Rhizina undulata]